jgi:DNA-binding protein H-NS
MCSILAAILPHKELTTLLPHLNGKTISVLLNNGQITEARAWEVMMERVMKRAELDRMSTDDLWSLHVEVSHLLQQRIQTEKLQLEERLKLLAAPVSGRRPYPPVPPKYRNPDQPSETWAGRGKQPRWLVAQLRSGRRMDDFRIKKAANRR